MSNIIIVGYSQEEAKDLRRRIDTILGVYRCEADAATVILDVETKWCGREKPAPYIVVRHSDKTKLEYIANVLRVVLNVDTEAELIHKYYPRSAGSPDFKTFINPDGAWSYDGQYSIGVLPNIDYKVENDLPTGVDVANNILCVSNGRIEQAPVGIQFYSEGKPFRIDYCFIRWIRDKYTNLLWVNYNYR